MTSDRATFRPDIEGLRGIAILLVVAFHAGVPRLAGGFVGVDVFFVLSGFLITGLLAREVTDTGTIDVAEFYARRARRLLPAFLVVLLATIAVAFAFHAPIDRPFIANDARAVALHYGNVVFAQAAVNYHAASGNPFLHTWSLAVEEQFYVIWPLLFLFVGRFYAGKDSIARQLMTTIAVAGVASFAASVWVTQHAQSWAFFSMPTRIWEFAIGGAAALYLASDRRRESIVDWNIGTPLQIVGLTAIGFATLTYHDATPYPGVAAVLPAIGTAGVLIGGSRATDGMITGILGAPILRWFGRLSYSWYLWHWPLVGLGAVIDWNIGVGGRLAWSAFALLLAMLTLRYVEQPMRDAERFRIRPQVLAGGAIVASFVAALLAVGALALARRQATSPVQRVFAAARNDRMQHDCWGSLLENATAPCEFGDLGSRTTVVLMGDSHAEHWLPAMDRLGRERGWKIIAMVKPACPVADLPEFINVRLKREYTECTTWRRAKMRRILAMRPSLVVLSSYDGYVSTSGDASSAWRVTPAAWEAGLRRTYATLSNAGLTTIVIRDVPDARFDAPGCLSRRVDGVPFSDKPCKFDLAGGISRIARDAQTRAARGLPRLGLVDMTDRICDGRRCSVIRRGAIVYRDGDHLTATFSRNEALVLAERIAALF